MFYMVETDVELAIRAAEVGSEMIRLGFRRTNVREIEQDNFVTETDIAVEQKILAIIGCSRPQDCILAEETGASGVLTSNRSWLVDPMCGTRNFAAHVPHVAINISLRIGDAVAVAVVADPFVGEVFWTAGASAYRRFNGEDTELTPHSQNKMVEINLEPPPPQNTWFRPAQLLECIDFRARFQPRVLSTTLALAWVAAGRRTAYITDGDLRDNVHFSSGIALCQAAGCIVTGLKGQVLHTPSYGLIAASDALSHTQLVEAVCRGQTIY